MNTKAMSKTAPERDRQRSLGHCQKVAVTFKTGRSVACVYSVSRLSARIAKKGEQVLA
jgi:hypothetical protein